MPMKVSGTHVSKEKLITLLLSFFASAAAGRNEIEIVRFTTFNNLLNNPSRAL